MHEMLSAKTNLALETCLMLESLDSQRSELWQKFWKQFADIWWTFSELQLKFVLKFSCHKYSSFQFANFELPKYPNFSCNHRFVLIRIEIQIQERNLVFFSREAMERVGRSLEAL